MNGRHIAIFTLPGVSHVYPFLGLIPELVRRGYRVTVATIKPVAKLVVSAGAEPVIVEPDRMSIPTAEAAIMALPINDPKRQEELAIIAFRSHLNCAAISVWQLNQFYEENRPDLVIYEVDAYAGRIFAKRFQAPAIQYYPDFLHHSNFDYSEGGVISKPQWTMTFSRLLDAFLSAYGFQETNNFWHTEDLNLYQFPREFQFNSDSIDSRRFCFVGPVVDRPFHPIWKNHSGGKPVILVSGVAGSFDDRYLNITIDALSGNRYHVILSVGEHFPISKQRALPPNFEINRYASHLEILPYTDLHLYSGGPNGTLEGLHFGVPLIAITSHFYNYIVANRLAELGVVPNLPFDALTSQMLRENVEAVMHGDAFLARTKQVQDVVRGSGGSARAVDRIEEFLARGTC